MYKKFIKRGIDLIVSITLSVILLPLFIVIYLILSIHNKGEVFFIQLRPGKNQKLFNIYKFKTMRDLKSEDGKLLSDEARTSSLGRVLRKFSLDEIPQLINVIKGEMSLIGPRPLLVQYLPLYNSFQNRRHELRPGITGWAQVNGRNAISWDERFEYDVWYVDNCSFLLDLKVIWKTLGKVITSDGVTTSENTSMEVFRGNG